MKTCSVCKQEKDIRMFYKQTDSKDGYTAACKLCCNARNLKWINAHKEVRNKYRREFMKNPQVKISHRGRSAIRNLIRNLGNEYKFLIRSGNTREELLTHLSRTVPKGYDFANDYGKTLCVDHIIPCCAFDLTKPEEFKKCFNQKNLRIVTKSENLKKNRKDVKKSIWKGCTPLIKKDI